MIGTQMEEEEKEEDFVHTNTYKITSVHTNTPESQIHVRCSRYKQEADYVLCSRLRRCRSFE